MLFHELHKYLHIIWTLYIYCLIYYLRCYSYNAHILSTYCPRYCPICNLEHCPYIIHIILSHICICISILYVNVYFEFVSIFVWEDHIPLFFNQKYKMHPMVHSHMKCKSNNWHFLLEHMYHGIYKQIFACAILNSYKIQCEVFPQNFITCRDYKQGCLCARLPASPSRPPCPPDKEIFEYIRVYPIIFKYIEVFFKVFKEYV
jgi:hypothetical protein